MPNIEDRAAEVLRQSKERATVNAQRNRERQQRRQEKKARKEARRTRKKERAAVRFLYRALGSQGEVSKFVNVRPGGMWFYSASGDAASFTDVEFNSTQPLLTIPDSPYSFIFYRDNWTKGLIPVCPDCGEYIEVAVGEHRAEKALIGDLAGLGAFLKEVTGEHVCPSSRPSSSSVQAAH